MRNGNDMIMRDVKDVPESISKQNVMIDGKYDHYDMLKAFLCLLGGAPMLGFSLYETLMFGGHELIGVDAFAGGALIGAAIYFFRRARYSR